MPIYEGECCKCHKKFEWYSATVSDETKDCPVCGGRADRLFSRYKPDIFRPFVTRNIDPSGVPIQITSQRQLSSLCNEHKLVHMDDPKYDPPQQKFPDVHDMLGVHKTPEAERGVDGGACRREDIA